MNRLWSRVGVRVASVGLLVFGVVGGVYLGQDREVPQRSSVAQFAVQARADEMQMLKDRHNEHAAARAVRTEAEGVAAAKAAREAKVAAGKARKLEQKAIAGKAAAKKAAEAKEAAAEAAAEAEAEESAESAESARSTRRPSGSGKTVPFTGPIPSSCNESGNKATGCALMVRAGFGMSQWPCLEKLWDKESNWNHKAYNRSSEAFGIPQALPGGKMSSAGSDWKTNPATQIKWGLGYIKDRYGSPCAAWSKSQSVGWY